MERELCSNLVQGTGTAAPLYFSGALEVFGAPALPQLFDSNNSYKMKAV